uniref:Uncharacterized protein n=1 Tax=Noccaea caerulescens TaxID=107243 RepID=A0A1J3CYG6_NOCCA
MFPAGSRLDSEKVLKLSQETRQQLQPKPKKPFPSSIPDDLIHCFFVIFLFRFLSFKTDEILCYICNFLQGILFS